MTLIVFILKNTEVWCGQKQSPGINFEKCPNYQHCPESAVGSFWKQMSKHVIHIVYCIVMYISFSAFFEKCNAICFEIEATRHCKKLGLVLLHRSRRVIHGIFIVLPLHKK